MGEISEMSFWERGQRGIAVPPLDISSIPDRLSLGGLLSSKVRLRFTGWS
jgi:hypothetical protein